MAALLAAKRYSPRLRGTGLPALDDSRGRGTFFNRISAVGLLNQIGNAV
jgi:hypothetical protein